MSKNLWFKTPTARVSFCKEGAPNSGFTINNKTSVNAAPVDVLVTGKPAKINLKFFAYADKDHMPLRRVMIDWDDGLGASLATAISATIVGPDKAGAVRQTRQNPIQKYVIAVPMWTTQTPALPARIIFTVPTNLSCYDDTDCKFVPQCANQDDATLFSFILDKTCDSSYFLFRKDLRL